MAVSSVILDIRANTTRALNDFKVFSSQLDNKFLVSGLKLDVVRNALGQINREFQKAIGEGGLTSGSSLKAAENQAALLTRTFKGFTSTTAKNITTDISTALNQVAITAGGTMEDIKKTISAAPFISTSFPEEVRKKFGEGLLAFQRDIRRAGVSDEFGNVAQQFLSGQTGAMDLINSGKPLESMLGAEIAKRAGTTSPIYDAKQRTEILKSIIEDPAIQKELKQMALETSGYRIFLEDLNTSLFNPRSGVFGSLREVTMSLGDKTTIFQETQKLIESIFGRQGAFVNFFKQVGKIFAIEDPLKAVIIGIRWITTQFNRLNKFLQSPEVQSIVEILQNTFKNLKDFVLKISESLTTNLQDPNSSIRQIGEKISSFFVNLKENVDKSLKDPNSLLSNIKTVGNSVVKFFSAIGETVNAGDWNAEKINNAIRDIGKNVRVFIENIGKTIRDTDMSTQGEFILSIIKTLVEEIAQTLGTVIIETIKVTFNKGPAILLGAVSVLEKALSGLFTGLFGGNKLVGKIFGNVALAGLGVLFIRKIRSALMSIIDPVFSEAGRIRRGGGGLRGGLNRLFSDSEDTRGARNLQGGRMGFQAQVIERMNRIITLLGGTAGSNLPDDSDGPGPRSQRNRRGRRGRRRDFEPRVRPSTIYTDPIGPLPSNSSDPWAETDLGYDPRLESRTRVRNRQDVISRYNRRYGTRARIGRGIKGFGKRALIAGGIAGVAGLVLNAGGAGASQINPETGEPILDEKQEKLKNRRENTRGMLGLGANLAGSVAGGAIGAAIGSIVPVVGTTIGGLLGGIIGGIVGEEGVKLLSDKVLDSIGDLGDDISKFFSSTVPNWWNKEIVDKFNSIRTGIGNSIQNIPSAISDVFSKIDWGKLLLGSLVPGGGHIMELATKFDISSILTQISNNIQLLLNPVGVIKSILEKIPLPNWMGGSQPRKEVGGPAIRGASILIGERGPEIFTPGATGHITSNRDLSTLLASASSYVGHNKPTQQVNFNITLNASGLGGEDLANSLRDPVIQILEQAWAEVTAGTSSRGTTIV